MNAIHIILAVLGGFVLGFIAARFALRGGKGEQEKLQTELDAVQQAFDAYRSRVDRHFADTADAVDELNRSYQNVIRHLSGGAQSLMGAAALREQLGKRSGKTVTVGYLAGQDGQSPAPAAAYENAQETVRETAAAEPAQAQPQQVLQQEQSENPEADTEPQTQLPAGETAQAETQEGPSENGEAAPDAAAEPPAAQENGTQNDGKTPA